ncbi:transglycosylase family protein [Pseudonocardia sp. KRD291]|uniref:transglycosylase family protein n=1 Tax=Pseudonocardia sp. KRD291 TaxID=2792007 RepID=UPI001C49E523|nr:transglycosylase family protein [Pseudonocardia sp. KRD291]MBW0106213.1 transglycosylase family protein [Pseudonocardia sp. KRD291]
MNKGTKGRSLLRLTVAGAVAVGASAAIAGTASAAPDDTWDALAQCESGGDWSTNTGNGYAGGLQFSPSTWKAYGGSGSASGASRSEQIAVAERVLAAQGWNAWPSCSKKTGASGKAETSKRVNAAAEPEKKSAPKAKRQSAPQAAPKATSKAAPKSAPIAGGHTVAAGETLSKIAAANGTSVGSLASLNGLADPDVLAVGQQLRMR